MGAASLAAPEPVANPRLSAATADAAVQGAVAEACQVNTYGFRDRSVLRVEGQDPLGRVSPIRPRASVELGRPGSC